MKLSSSSSLTLFFNKTKNAVDNESINETNVSLMSWWSLSRKIATLFNAAKNKQSIGVRSLYTLYLLFLSFKQYVCQSIDTWIWNTLFLMLSSLFLPTFNLMIILFLLFCLFSSKSLTTNCIWKNILLIMVFIIFCPYFSFLFSFLLTNINVLSRLKCLNRSFERDTCAFITWVSWREDPETIGLSWHLITCHGSKTRKRETRSTCYLWMD